MATLNLMNAAVVNPLRVTYQCTDALADVLTVAADHCNLVKKIRAANNDAAADYSVDIVLLKSGGSARYLAKAIPVIAGAAVDIWSGALPLDEGDKIRALGSTTLKIDLTISGFDLS